MIENVTPDDLRRLREYLASAIDATAGPSSVGLSVALMPLLKGSTFLQNVATYGSGADGHMLVRFWPPTPEPISEPRVMKLAHAAITRALEVCGGEIYYGRHEDRGRARFKLWLRIGGRVVSYGHILFGAPDSGRLKERRGRYHYLTPDSYRFQYSLDRAGVVDIVRRTRGQEAADLLKDLFEFSAAWHGSELEVTGRAVA